MTQPTDDPTPQAEPIPPVVKHIALWLSPVLILLALLTGSKELGALAVAYSSIVVGAVILWSAFPYSMTQLRKWGWYGLVWLGVYAMTTILFVYILIV